MKEITMLVNCGISMIFTIGYILFLDFPPTFQVVTIFLVMFILLNQINNDTEAHEGEQHDKE